MADSNATIGFMYAWNWVPEWSKLMQWIATIPGEVQTDVVLDLDEFEGGLRGYVLLTYPQGPYDFAFLNLPLDQKTHNISIAFRPIYPGSLATMKDVDVRPFYPNGYNKSAQVQLTFGSDHLELAWTDQEGKTGRLSVPNSRAGEPSDLPVDNSITTWLQFKQETSKIAPERFVFRGQGRNRRLRTAFHRTGRSDLTRYVLEDLPRAHRATVGKTRHLFNRQNADENAAFLHLLQHHGFPTPLLDWSESPFIAAFFAYHNRRAPTEDEGPVRICVFDKTGWQRGLNQLNSLELMGPHLSIIEPLGIENDRALPQQALSTVTNIDDIEGYVHRRETEHSHRFLYAIDLPYEDRVQALRDLAMMGITAGSMFPGLDGICQEMTDRLFGYDRR